MKTFREMAVEDLVRSDATKDDLRAFQEACERVLPTFGFDQQAATEYIWHDGDYASRLTAGLCTYCGTLVDDVVSAPALEDDEAWAATAQTHKADCEWVMTRAHRVIPFEDIQPEDDYPEDVEP